MSQPYVGEIRCFGFDFAPAGWQSCNGALMPISENETLFQLIGTTYGGDGQSTFAVPDLQGRAPMHWGNGAGGPSTTIAQIQGTENVTLTTNQIPIHNHAIVSAIVAPGGATEHLANPTLATVNAYLGTSAPDQVYNISSPTIDKAFANSAIGNNGGSQPHETRQPYLALNFCISLFGIFPSPT